MSGIPPGPTARGDQIIAATDRILDNIVARFKAEVDADNGNPLGPIADFAVEAASHPVKEVAFLLAVAVKRLALPRTEIPQ